MLAGSQALGLSSTPLSMPSAWSKLQNSPYIQITSRVEGFHGTLQIVFSLPRLDLRHTVRTLRFVGRQAMENELIIRHRLLTGTSTTRGEPPLKKLALA